MDPWSKNYKYLSISRCAGIQVCWRAGIRASWCQGIGASRCAVDGCHWTPRSKLQGRTPSSALARPSPCTWLLSQREVRVGVDGWRELHFLFLSLDLYDVFSSKSSLMGPHIKHPLKQNRHRWTWGAAPRRRENTVKICPEVGQRLCVHFKESISRCRRGALEGG